MLATLALGGLTYALIEWGGPLALRTPPCVAVLAGGRVRGGREAGAGADAAARASSRDRTFSAANAMTLLVYAALGASLFFVTLQLQTVSGWTALEAGLASFPITICMIFLAAKGGEIGARIGPRIPMTRRPDRDGGELR